MIGALIGDVIGSVYEHDNIKSTDFNLYDPFCGFTDDTVMTVAVADGILNNKNFGVAIKQWGNKYPDAGYGGKFRQWLKLETLEPYNSWGNGSAMRVSPVSYAYENLEEVLCVAKITAEQTHNHPEGIKGVQATASAIFLARQGKTKQDIKDYIETTFHYDLARTTDEIRPTYTFDVSCKGSVPEAIIAFLESTDFESAIRLAISLGGDSDTIACIAGGIAEAYYKKIDQKLIDFARKKLNPDILKIVDEFEKTFSVEY